MTTEEVTINVHPNQWNSITNLPVPWTRLSVKSDDDGVARTGDAEAPNIRFHFTSKVELCPFCGAKTG